MKYKIEPDDYMSRAMYNLASDANREYLEHFVGLFTREIGLKALEVCTDITNHDNKPFDSGYVKGLREAVELIVASYKKGRRLHYGEPSHKQEPPKKF